MVEHGQKIRIQYSEEVGRVGNNKRVHRIISNFSFATVWAVFWNFHGYLCLERHDFERIATNIIDEGVFVVSGRTSAHRSEVIKEELTCFDKVSPLIADDDNLIAGQMVDHGWKLKIPYSEGG